MWSRGVVDEEGDYAVQVSGSIPRGVLNLFYLAQPSSIRHFKKIARAPTLRVAHPAGSLHVKLGLP